MKKTFSIIVQHSLSFMSIPRIKGISKVIKLSPSPTLLDTKIYFLEKIEKLPVSFKEGSIC